MLSSSSFSPLHTSSSIHPNHVSVKDSMSLSLDLFEKRIRQCEEKEEEARRHGRKRKRYTTYNIAQVEDVSCNGNQGDGGIRDGSSSNTRESDDTERYLAQKKSRTAAAAEEEESLFLPLPLPPAIQDKSEKIHIRDILTQEMKEKDFLWSSQPRVLPPNVVQHSYSSDKYNEEDYGERSSVLRLAHKAHRSISQIRNKKSIQFTSEKNLYTQSKPRQAPVNIDYLRQCVSLWNQYKKELADNAAAPPKMENIISRAALVQHYSRQCALHEKHEVLEFPTNNPSSIKERFALHICAVKTCAERAERFKLGFCQKHYMNYYRQTQSERREEKESFRLKIDAQSKRLFHQLCLRPKSQ